MADTSVSKLISQTVADAKTTGQSRAKVNPSKFDQVRAKLEQPVTTTAQRTAQNTAPISTREGKQFEVELKSRLEQVRQRDLNEIFNIYVIVAEPAFSKSICPLKILCSLIFCTFQRIPGPFGEPNLKLGKFTSDYLSF